MARPNFSNVWGSTNAPFTAITDTDYKAGWAFRTGAPPRRVNFDYFQNLSDLRHKWLVEQMLLAVGHEWQADITYGAYAVVRSPINGQLYRSLVGSNLNNEPSVSGSQWALGVVQVSSNLPLGYFSGFTITNNSGAPNTTVDVGAGTARSSDNTVDITLTSTIRGILQSSGSWAAGDNQNKLDTGARADSNTYHVFVIGHPTLADDILYSLSATAPTLPAGYAGFRRTGRIVTDGNVSSGGNIRPFKDRGDGCFEWATPSIEVTLAVAAPGGSLLALSGMAGGQATARIQSACLGDGAAIRVIPTDVADLATSTVPATWTGGVIAQAGGGSGNESASGESQVRVDTSGQVRVRTYTATGNLDYRIIVFGWKESR